MSYIPHTHEDTEKMLAAVGVSSIAELFSAIPDSLKNYEFNLSETVERVGAS